MTLKVFIALVLAFTFSSCKTTKNVQYHDHYIDHYITQVMHDTLREHTTDSVYLEVMQKGDTVYRTKYKEVVKWRDRVVERTDTCYRDSIVTEYKEMTKEVKYVPKIYHLSMCISILVLILAMLKIAWWLKSKSLM